MEDVFLEAKAQKQRKSDLMVDVPYNNNVRECVCAARTTSASLAARE